MGLSVGSLAPDFTLKNQHGQDITLSSFRGRPVVLVFYPFAFTGICTGELCEIRDQIGVFADSDVELLAISCDTFFTLRVFADREGYEFQLLSDFWPHGAVAQAYDVFEEGPGAARRGSFLIDSGGVIVWNVDHGLGEARDFSAYRESLATLR